MTTLVRNRAVHGLIKETEVCKVTFAGIWITVIRGKRSPQEKLPHRLRKQNLYILYISFEISELTYSLSKTFYSQRNGRQTCEV
ncbi:hypothetical protein AWC38_SpisGene911 [Stylophora pistillata]|uniref:Uncharacterized protein n=1 Tax=Stylophora pistillata TaxID=50429 RepID=A0A2B4T0B4_STYPI|nr:hypothetical protein AWC38_SpisGene911 [Stylophora pistillata]